MLKAGLQAHFSGPERVDGFPWVMVSLHMIPKPDLKNSPAGLFLHHQPLFPGTIFVPVLYIVPVLHLFLYYLWPNITVHPRLLFHVAILPASLADANSCSSMSTDIAHHLTHLIMAHPAVSRVSKTSSSVAKTKLSQWIISNSVVQDGPVVTCSRRMFRPPSCTCGRQSH